MLQLIRRRTKLALRLAALWTICPGGLSAQLKAPVDYVNPYIGTDKSSHFTVWEANGAVFPGVLLPHGMVQIAPDNYFYSDKKIKSFSFLNHHSGWSSRGSFNLMAFTGEVPAPGQTPVSGYTHHHETTTPYLYQVKLDDYGIDAAFTATTRTGLCRFTFPKSSSAHFLLTDSREVTADNDSQIRGRCAQYYFIARFSKPFESLNSERSAKKNYDPSADKPFTGGFLVNYSTGKKEDILIKLAFSTTSYPGAQSNMDRELPGWDFGRTVSDSKKIWNEKLGQIEIKTSDERQKKIFYTALYHCLFMPVILSDAGSGKDRYSHLYPWDTYRSEHPLTTILDPGREADMISSVLADYDSTGWLPADNMLGNHNIQVILDDYEKGVRNFDISKACEAICKSLLDTPYARREMADFVKYGFVPARVANSVSHSLEFAYDNWAAARFLERTGNKKKYLREYQTLLKRAGYYQNSFDPSSGLMSARNIAGDWTDGGYCEGTAWTYSWYVPHDVQGLINLMGGEIHFLQKLDQCFEEGHYIHDNEPPLHYAYLFDFAGQPWKSQQYARQIVEGSYSDDPGGLPGNDDLGALSSWFVFSAMGFYPVTPGIPQYAIGSPIFQETVLHFNNGKQLHILANHVSRENKYIQSATLNGVSLDRAWLTHKELLNGKLLVFEMGAHPNPAWASGKKSRPYSMTGEISHFVFSDLLTSALVTKANQPIDLSVRVLNKSKVSGSAVIPLRIDGKTSHTASVFLQPGENKVIHTGITVFSEGTHLLQIPGLAARKIKVQKTAAAFVYSDLKIPSPPLVRSSDSILISANVKNVGSYLASTVIRLFINGKEAQSKKMALHPGEKKEIGFKYAQKIPGACRVAIGNLKPAELHFSDTSQKRIGGLPALSSMKPLLIMDFDDGPVNSIRDGSGQGNNGIVHGKLNWVEGIFGKAVQIGKADNYIAFPDSCSLSQADLDQEMTIMAWVYPMEEKNFADIISKGDWNALQLKGSNQFINFYTGGWEGHEAAVAVPENWNRHWHHLAGVADGSVHRLYIDGVLVQTKTNEPRDPQGETGIINYSGSPWNIGRNASSPERVFNGYIDDVMIFKKSLDRQQIFDLMLHNFRMAD